MMNNEEMIFKKKHSVLVVEDEETALKLYERIFHEMGQEIVIASTGEKALENIEHKYFSLIILDLKLPDMEGTALLNNIKQNTGGTPVIIVTAHPSLESSIEAIRSGGVYDYIIKPIDIENLKMVVNRALERSALAHENKRLVNRLEATNQALTERVEELEEFARIEVDYEKRVSELEQRIKELETRSRG